VLLASRKAVVESTGHEVIGAASDDEAMEVLAQEDAFDLVVVGTSVPKKDFQVIENRIREKHPKTFIVMIQQEWATRGASPNSFVVEGMPHELVEAIRLLLFPESAAPPL
jgi:DNA-binding NarL/FixJ family response regulator